VSAPESYEPRAQFSPSGLSVAERCTRAWGFRYLLGYKRPELKWLEAVALEKPKPAKKSKPTPAERAALKAYNSKFRPALGVECHARAEAYYRGQDVEWNDLPGQVILAGMRCVTHPDECERVEAEGAVEIEVDGIKFKGFRDLLVFHNGRWLLIDWKTTFTFDYFDREKTKRTVKTRAQLEADTQANLYAWAVMRDKGLRELACRWVYCRTEGAPAAIPVDFTITWEGARAIVSRLVAEAKALLAYIETIGAESMARRLPLVRDMQGNPEACEDFGGCDYHPDKGGPCTPPTLSPGERMRRAREKQQTKAATPPNSRPKPVRPARSRAMGFRDKMKAKQEETTVDTTATEVETETVTAVTDSNPEPVVVSKRAKSTKRAPEDGPEILIAVEGGTAIVLPRTSPLYRQAAAVFAALYPEG
jgi:hypothetical protein